MANKLFNPQIEKAENIYTKKVAIPQYAPSKHKPDITGLADIRKYSKLLYEINTAEIPEEEKTFLRLAASRHIVFNYSLIADYYAHSDKQAQELMEKSALVILDIEDALANGYVKLSKDINKLLDESGVFTGGTDE